jgi:thiol:disulfide interchange protein
MGLFLVVLALYYVKTAWDSFAGSESSGSVAPEVAEKMFEESTKPVFVKVGAPWCKNCTAMDRSVLREEDVLKALEDFTVIKIRINDFAELANYGFLKPLKITGLPAYAVFPPQAPEPDCAHEPLGEDGTK